MSCARTLIRMAIYALASISFCLFQYFSVPDVWKLDLWYTCIHYPGVHGHAKGNASHTHTHTHVMLSTSPAVCIFLFLTVSTRFSLPWTHITGRGSTTLSYGGHCFSMSSSPSCGEASFGTACPVTHLISLNQIHLNLTWFLCCVSVLQRPFLNYQRMYYVFMQMLSSGPAWLSIIMLIIVSLLPDVVKKVLCRALWPTTTERIQVRQLTIYMCIEMKRYK